MSSWNLNIVNFHMNKFKGRNIHTKASFEYWNPIVGVQWFDIYLVSVMEKFVGEITLLDSVSPAGLLLYK